MIRDYAKALRDSGRFLVDRLTKARQGIGTTVSQPIPVPVVNRPDVRQGRAKSAFLDPMQANFGFGYRERTFQSSFEVARELTIQAPIVGIIISTRANECLPFTKRSMSSFSPGFKIVLRDEKEKPTAKSAARAKELERFIEHTGDPDNSALRDDFSTFVYKVATDSLMFAQMAAEIVPDRAGRPNQFYAVDASTIRIAQYAQPYDSDDLEKEVRHVQVVDGRILTTYTREQLMFGIRNPSTDVRMSGYGISEIEKVQRACAAILQSWEHNVRAFTQGTSIRGIINIREPMGPEQFEDFRDDFYRWARGVDNAHTTSVMNSEAGFDYTNLAQTNDQMGYGDWTNFLIKILCAAYNTAPDLIGFNYGNVGQDNALGQASNEWKITQSKERGLRPLVDHIFGLIDERIIKPLDENFRLVHVGLDQMTPEQAEQINTSQVRSVATVDEIRARTDQPPLPDGTGAIILDPTWLQNRSMMQMQAQQAQQAQQYADPNALQQQDPPQEQAEDQQPETDGGQANEGLDADSPDGSTDGPTPADAAEQDGAQKSLSGGHTWQLRL